MARPTPVTIERIERAMDEVALAIDMAGDRGIMYLSIFTRLDHELADLKLRQSTMEKVSDRLKLLSGKLNRRAQ